MKTEARGVDGLEKLYTWNSELLFRSPFLSLCCNLISSLHVSGCLLLLLLSWSVSWHVVAFPLLSLARSASFTSSCWPVAVRERAQHANSFTLCVVEERTQQRDNRNDESPVLYSYFFDSQIATLLSRFFHFWNELKPNFTTHFDIRSFWIKSEWSSRQRRTHVIEQRERWGAHTRVASSFMC